MENSTFKGQVAEPVQGMLFSRDYRLRLDLFVDKGLVHVQGTTDDTESIRLQSGE